jgi:hypothetical protein
MNRDFAHGMHARRGVSKKKCPVGLAVSKKLVASELLPIVSSKWLFMKNLTAANESPHDSKVSCFEPP